MKRTLGFSLVAVALSGAASADVLYDTLLQAYDVGNGNAIAGAGVFGATYDLQTADDFSLATGYTMDAVSQRSVCFPGFPTTPAGGVLVEFFAPNGALPSETPTASYLATGGEVTTTLFTDSTFGLQGVQFDVNLAAAGISLGAGTWWVAITPVDETGGANWYYQTGATGGNGAGRDGGVDHGNGYGGGYGSNDWFTLGAEYSMRIEGTIIPAPGAIALLGLAGMVSRRRRRA